MASSPSPCPMLSIPEKKPAPADLYPALHHHVSTHYSEHEAQLNDHDLRAVHTLRSDLVRPLPPSARRDLLLSYSRALSAALPRLPSLPVHLTWHDAFRPSRKATAQGLPFDRAATLFCLASTYTHLAAAEDRRSEDGRKAACNAYLAAAGALGFLRLRASPEVKAAAVTVDLTPECVGMLEKLMLAQAQECFFEKVVADGKACAICSKVARQVSLYYEEVNSALNSAQLSQHMGKAWICHVRVKAALFHAEACYRVGLDLHEKEEIGEEIARLKDGIKALAGVKKSAKGAGTLLLEAINKLKSVMNSNLAKAVKENDQVYLLHVPAADSLEPLPGVSLVKPMVMDELLDGSKEKLFASFVPDGSAKALSRYTEMVDDIIGTQAEKLQQESEITRVKLKEMGLPDFILALEGNLCLPADLKEDVETVQAAGGLSALEADLRELENLKTVNQELLVQLEEILEKEERDDDQFRTQFGTRWTRAPARTLTKNIHDRLGKFAAATKQAGESDACIQRDVKDNSELLAVLDCRPIESAIPSLAKPIMSFDGKEGTIVGTLKQCLRQHEALGAQRASLVDMLKEMKRKDGILLKLMATSGSDEDLFKKEISKYDPICEDIVQNTRAQENLLHEIQVQNDEFSAIFNLEDYKVQRERCYKQIAAAVAKFKEIKANINGGLKFYVTLQEAIANVKQQCSDFVTRGIECQETIQDVQAKIANFDISSDERTGYKYPSSLPTPCRPQQIDPRNEQQYPPYTQEPPFQHPNQVRQQYQPPSAPPLQEPNPRDGLPNQPYQRLPPPQQPNPWDGLPYQPSPRMPEPWTTPAHQPYPQPPPYYQPPYEQRYPQPPSYPSYVTAPQPPPYASPTANFYQPPPPGPLLQPPCTEYGQHACYCPQHHGAPPQHTAAYNGLEQYPPYGSYLGVPK